MHEDNTDLCSLCARSEAAVRYHVNSSFAPHTECTQTWGGSRHISTLLLRCSGSVTSHEHTETNVCTVSIPLQLKASSFPLTLQIPFFSHFLLQSDMRVFRASGVHATALRIKKLIHKKKQKVFPGWSWRAGCHRLIEALGGEKPPWSWRRRPAAPEMQGMFTETLVCFALGVKFFAVMLLWYQSDYATMQPILRGLMDFSLYVPLANR